MLSFIEFLLETEQRIAGIKANPAHQNISIDHDQGAQKAGFVHFDPVARSHAVIDHLASHDPTHLNGNKNTEWMVNQYKKGHMRLEDGPRVGGIIKKFHTAKAALPNKDLNSYTLDSKKEPKKIDIHDVLNKHEEHNASFPDGPRFEGHPGAKLIHDDGKGTTVHILHSHAAGRAARDSCGHSDESGGWCFGWKKSEHFDSYSRQGPIHILQTPDNRKHAIHLQSNQIMDIHDRDVPAEHLLKKYPQISQVKSFKEQGVSSLDFLNKQEKNEVLTKHLKTALESPPHEHRYEHYERARKIANHIEKEPDLHKHFYPMANHENHEIRQIAAEQGPHHIKQKLINDIHDHVRKAVAETTKDPRHLDTLVRDRKETVQAGVLNNKETAQPSHAEYLAHHGLSDHIRESGNWAHYQMTGKAVKTTLGLPDSKPGTQRHFNAITSRMNSYQSDVDWLKKRTQNKIGSPSDQQSRKAAYATERMKHGMSELKKHYPGVMDYHKEQEKRFGKRASKIPSLFNYADAVMKGLHKEPKT